MKRITCYLMFLDLLFFSSTAVESLKGPSGHLIKTRITSGDFTYNPHALHSFRYHVNSLRVNKSNPSVHFITANVLLMQTEEVIMQWCVRDSNLSSIHSSGPRAGPLLELENYMNLIRVWFDQQFLNVTVTKVRTTRRGGFWFLKSGHRGVKPTKMTDGAPDSVKSHSHRTLLAEDLVGLRNEPRRLGMSEACILLKCPSNTSCVCHGPA